MDADYSFHRRTEFNFFNLSCSGANGHAYLVYLENPQGLYYEGIEFYIKDRIYTTYFRNDDEWNTSLISIVDPGTHEIYSLLKKIASSKDSNYYKHFMNYYSPYVPLFGKLVKNTVEGNDNALHFEQIECPTDGQLYDAFVIQIKNQKPYEQLDAFLLSHVESFLSLSMKGVNDFIKISELSDQVEKDFAADKRMLTKGIIINFIKLGITATTGIPNIPSIGGIIKHNITRPY